MLEALASGIFPGAVCGVAVGPPERRGIFVKAWGRLFAPSLRHPEDQPLREDVVFDLASLTKPLATVLAVLCLRRAMGLDWDTPLPSLLDGPIPADKAGITLRHLLAHASGLPAHRPYFETLRTLPRGHRKAAIQAAILAEPLDALPGTQAIYSDLGFLLLGFMLEERLGQPLDQLVRERVLAPIGLTAAIGFNPIGRPFFAPGTPFAPTEDCPWRGSILRGEVHDDNAHVLGGVAGHAGLFGTAGGVLALATHLLDLVRGRATHPGFSPADLCLAAQPAHLPPGSPWGLGFDTPSPQGSSAGRHLSPVSFGHLGFTGTSLWCDPRQDLVIVLLTNRVHPRRDNVLIRDFRPRFHDAVVACLQAGGLLPHAG